MTEQIKAVKLVRKIREKQYDEIKNKNLSEKIGYFKSRANELNIKRKVSIKLF